MIDLFVGRPFLRDSRSSDRRWVPVVLVLRRTRLSVFDEVGTGFDVEVERVRATFSRSATLILEVDGKSYVFSNLPANSSPPITAQLSAIVDELYAEVVQSFRLAGLGKPPAAYWKNWRTFLEQNGVQVSGAKGNLERAVIRTATVVSITLLASILGLIVWLIANGGRPA